MTEPTIVVGAGAGGLAAALTLAARGRPVRLLEQHAAVGGRIRRLTSAGQPFDAGPTVFTMRWVFDQLFESAGQQLDDWLTLIHSPLLARHSWFDGSRLDLHADLEASVEAIRAFSGGCDAEAYRAFVRESGRIFDTLDRPFMRASRPGPLQLAGRVGLTGLPALLATRPFVSLWKALEQRFRDPRLRQLFGRYATYTGSSPFLAPATLMLISEAERRGVYQVEGGMHALAAALRELILQLGGEIRTGARVERILVEHGRVAGVRLAGGERLRASSVVFNGDVAALREGLLGPEVVAAIPRTGLRGSRSLSAVTWGMVASVTGWPLAHHTVLFGDDYREEFDAIFRRGEVAASPTLYLCAQDRVGVERRTASGAERLFCLLNAPSGGLDEDQVQACETALQRAFLRHGLSIEGLQGVPWRQTPGDFAALFPATEGALYGRATHGWMGSFSRLGSRTRLPGLHLAGASVHPGAGVPMATLSGQRAAEAVLADG